MNTVIQQHQLAHNIDLFLKGDAEHQERARMDAELELEAFNDAWSIDSDNNWRSRSPDWASYEDERLREIWTTNISPPT